MWEATTIDNVRVFDGAGRTEPRSVHLDGGRIVSAPPDAARRVDARGGTLLPGLIDTHVHVEDRADLEASAHWGVTTVLDMGTPHLDRTMPLRHLDAVADLFSAGHPAVAPGATAIRKMGYPPSIGVADPSGAEEHVAARVRDGADYVKILVEDPKQPGTKALDRATVQALVDAAHRHGLTVIAHTVTGPTFRTAVDAGADVVTHVPVQAVVSREAARPGLVVSPTLVMMRGICATIGRRPALRALAALRVMPRMDFTNSLDSVRRLHHAGATVLAGTDANRDPATPFSPPHGEAMHQELGLLVEAGLSPVEALRAATVRPAQVFGLADRGEITAGRRADLLLVDGDPTTDIGATRNITGVWVAGHRFRGVPGS
ncbi:amidohydrolase family protein [Jidongwangia harbinensis]|uniref:amidohydrolase family protein n=1 Tax=Jidongwangia harbinensis TaxID=2878561 RepID=UPI001CD9BF8C|nr:amidohydrolase family protein [Jidongwangia harbinensis]MCA2211311.1 amidohydrolase family protein [Jidongwangia harbinensis]